MNSPKVLIIDDEKTVKKAMQKALKNEGYDLIFAENGKKGLELLKKEKPSLVFLDLKMPIMDGIEFLEKIKISHKDPYHVVVITGHGEDADIDKCYGLGVNSFLRKPLSMTEVCCLAKRCIHLKQIEAELEEHRTNLQKLVDEKTVKIQEQLTFQQTLIDAIPAPIFFKDTAFNFIGCNKAFVECLGSTKKKIIGKNFADLIPAINAKKEAAKDALLLKNKKPQMYQAVLPFKDGKKHDIAFNKAVFKGPDDQVAGIIGVIFDNTEREQAISKLAEKSKALNHANLSLRIMIKQLSDAQNEERVGNIPNLKELVLPATDQLEAILSSPSERAYLENIMLNLNRVTSTFAKKLSQMDLGMSPKEIQVADLIRIGLSNKESAIQMNVTKSTVEFHRDNLRKKLGLKHKKKNLRSYLMALDAQFQKS